MSDETAPAPDAAPAPEATEDKPKAPRKPRSPRKPTFKDWVRVVKSQGAGCENKTIHLIINTANNVATLVTNAPKSEDSEEMEGERRQIFKISSYEVIDVPDPEPEPEPEVTEEAAPAPAE